MLATQADKDVKLGPCLLDWLNNESGLVEPFLSDAILTCKIQFITTKFSLFKMQATNSNSANGTWFFKVPNFGTALALDFAIKKALLHTKYVNWDPKDLTAKQDAQVQVAIIIALFIGYLISGATAMAASEYAYTWMAYVSPVLL